MNYYALFYEVVDGFVNRRAPFRQEHLRLANEARERGEIIFAGALAEPAAALIVFHVDDKTNLESIRNFAGTDLEAAVVGPEAAALLTTFDRRVQHSEIAVRDVL